MLNDLTLDEYAKLWAFIGFIYDGSLKRAASALFTKEDNPTIGDMQNIRAYCSIKAFAPDEKLCAEIWADLPDYAKNKDYRPFLA